jgi:NADP-reducing hydrogenase subunit HndC
MFRSHIMVCGGTGCTSSGSKKIIEALTAKSQQLASTKKLKLSRQAVSVFVLSVQSL